MLLKEKRLIQRFNAGDTQALQDMYTLYKHDLMTLAAMLLFDKALAEDVIHEVFARLIEQNRPLNIRVSLKGYLLTAVANRARNVNRSESQKPLLASNDSLDHQGGTQPPEQFLIQTEEWGRLQEALQQLPYDQREVILLRHFGRMKFKTIAAYRETSISTIQGRYRYGLEKLQSLLGGDL